MKIMKAINENLSKKSKLEKRGIKRRSEKRESVSMSAASAAAIMASISGGGEAEASEMALMAAMKKMKANQLSDRENVA
jgi:hypothetical protein